MSAFSKRIWLTGAASALGQALAERLLRDGHCLALSACDGTSLQALAGRYPSRALILPGNLNDTLEITAISAHLAEQWGALDCMILNVDSASQVPDQADSLEPSVRSELFSASRCIIAALPLLRQAKSGHLVGIASPADPSMPSFTGDHGASDRALRYLLESLRVDLAHEGIAVTVVKPGVIGTASSAKRAFFAPRHRSASQIANRIVSKLEARPLEIVCPARVNGALNLLHRLREALGRSRRT